VSCAVCSLARVVGTTTLGTSLRYITPCPKPDPLLLARFYFAPHLVASPCCSSISRTLGASSGVRVATLRSLRSLYFGFCICPEQPFLLFIPCFHRLFLVPLPLSRVVLFVALLFVVLQNKKNSTSWDWNAADAPRRRPGGPHRGRLFRQLVLHRVLRPVTLEGSLVQTYCVFFTSN